MNRIILAVPIMLAVGSIIFSFVNPDLISVKLELCGEYSERKDDCDQILATSQLVRIPAQPANTYSNIAFLIVGLLALRRRRDWIGVGFLLACTALAIGSAAFHALLSAGGQRWDVLGMFFVLNFLAIYAMDIIQKTKHYGVTVFASAMLSLLVALFVTQLSSTLIVAIGSIFILAHLTIAVINKLIRLKAMLFAIAPFAVAFLFRQLDVTGVLSNPQSLFQGHAVWHIFAAWGFLKIFLLMDEMRLSVDPETAHKPAGVKFDTLSVPMGA